MLLQTLFIVQSIFGWYNWNKPSKYPIKWLSGGSKESVLGITGLLIVLFSIIIKNKGGHSPYLDGTTTALSVVAMLLMAYRKIESWILWIIADIIFIIFFYINELYLSSGIYSVFLILAILGLFEFRSRRRPAGRQGWRISARSRSLVHPRQEGDQHEAADDHGQAQGGVDHV